MGRQEGVLACHSKPVFWIIPSHWRCNLTYSRKIHLVAMAGMILLGRIKNKEKGKKRKEKEKWQRTVDSNLSQANGPPHTHTHMQNGSVMDRTLLHIKSSVWSKECLLRIQAKLLL